MRLFSHQRFVGCLVYIRFYFFISDAVDDFPDVVFRGVLHAFLVGTEDRHHQVGVADERPHRLVDGIHRDEWHNLVHDGIFLFDAGDRFVVDEVAHVFVHVSPVLLLVAFFVGRFQVAQVFGFGAGVFRGSEAEAVCAFYFPVECGKCRFDAIVRAGGDAGEGVFRLCHVEVAVVSAGIDEGRVRFLPHFIEAGIEHLRDDAPCVIIYKVVHRCLGFVRHSLMFVEQVDEHAGLFFVFFEGDDGVFVVRHRVIHPFGWVFRHFDVGKQVLYFVFDLVYIDVAYHDDALLVGPVPFFIKVA